MKLANTVIGLKALRLLYSKLRDIRDEVDQFFFDLLKQIESSEWKSGSVRAEFRLKLSDVGSIMPLLNHLFSLENVKNWTCVYDSFTIARLAKFYIYSFKIPMMDSLISILRQFDNRQVNNVEIMERITTISIVESLLTATLFSGMTYSYSSELVWNRSTVECISLELMKHIKSKNRPVFQESFLTNGVFRITADYSILEKIFKKITRNKVFQFPPIDIILEFNDTNDAQVKCDLLWRIYFAELNPNAFLLNQVPRWKIDAINREVITRMIQSPRNFASAVKAIFDFDHFKMYGSWRNKYYLSMAVDWVGERGGPKQKRLDEMLEESIRNLGIEHIHYAGKDNYNANSATHVPLNWSGQTGQERAAAMNIPLSDLDQLRLVWRGTAAETNRWLDHDVFLLVKGMNLHQEDGRQTFNNIYQDDRLRFQVRREPSKLRNKWKQLVEKRIVLGFPGSWYIPGSEQSQLVPENLVLAPTVPQISPTLPTHPPTVPQPVSQVLQIERPPAPTFSTIRSLSDHFTAAQNEPDEVVLYNDDYDFNDNYDYHDLLDNLAPPENLQNNGPVSQSNDQTTPTSDSIFDALIGKI